MTLSVWTASHIDVPERWNSLIECVISVANQNVPHYISLSTDVSIDVSELKKFDNVHLELHKKTLKQFEHFEHLNKTISNISNISDFIMFMDDDDVLCSLPSVIEQRRSKQYNKNGRLSGKSLYTRFFPYEDKDNILSDFSGTISSREHLKDFLKTYKNHDLIKIVLPDLIFMCSIKKEVNDKPYVFRRHWNPFMGYTHYWQKNM